MHINIVQETEYTLNNENNENTVILEKCRKNQIWTNYDGEIHVTKFGCGLKREIPSATRDGKKFIHSPIEQRRKQRAPPLAATPTVPALAVLIVKRASQASSVANETTATFDLTHKRDKSNIIYQKPIKNRHLDKIKYAFSNI
jgi:hypothetical protein